MTGIDWIPESCRAIGEADMMIKLDGKKFWRKILDAKYFLHEMLFTYYYFINFSGSLLIAYCLLQWSIEREGEHTGKATVFVR